MTQTATGLAIVLIVLFSLGSAIYEATHRPHGSFGTYMPDPHGTALPNM